MIEILQEIYTQSPLEFWLGIIFIIRAIICLRKIFVKAGRKGWEALIPVWHIYVLFKIAKRVNPWFWILLPLPIIAYGLMFFLALSMITLNREISEHILWIYNGIGIIAVCIYAIMLYGLALAFGKSKLFMLGLFFFGPIFFGILAFDKSKYLK